MLPPVRGRGSRGRMWIERGARGWPRKRTPASGRGGVCSSGCALVGARVRLRGWTTSLATGRARSLARVCLEYPNRSPVLCSCASPIALQCTCMCRDHLLPERDVCDQIHARVTCSKRRAPGPRDTTRTRRRNDASNGGAITLAASRLVSTRQRSVGSEIARPHSPRGGIANCP